MIEQQWIENKIDGLERGLTDLKLAVASLEAASRSEKSVIDKHDGLLRRLSELVTTVNITLSALERGVNGLPIKVAEQARDLERLSARIESLNGDLRKTAAAEVAGRYATSRAVIAAGGSIVGGLLVWLVK